MSTHRYQCRRCGVRVPSGRDYCPSCAKERAEEEKKKKEEKEGKK